MYFCHITLRLIASCQYYKALNTTHQNRPSQPPFVPLFVLSGTASERGRENVGGVGGASQDRAGATAKASRLPDPESHEGVHVAADRQQGQEGQEGRGEGQGRQEGEEMRGEGWGGRLKEGARECSMIYLTRNHISFRSLFAAMVSRHMLRDLLKGVP